MLSATKRPAPAPRLERRCGLRNAESRIGVIGRHTGHGPYWIPNPIRTSSRRSVRSSKK